MNQVSPLLKQQNKQYIILSCCFIIITFCSVFCFSSKMIDTHILPKWLFTFRALGVIGILYGISKFCNYQLIINIKFCHIVFLITALVQAVYALLQRLGVFPSCFINKVVGSFDNPAGLAMCVCIGISSCIYLFKTIKNKVSHWMLAASMFVLCGVVILSGSRAGVIGTMVIILHYLLRYILKKRIIKVMLVSIIIPILVIMYYAKKESADGRILIMRCCWEMFKERPIWGHGVGAFKAHYMDYQATYLTTHHNDNYYMLADNVKHAFNEFAMIAVEFGIVGCLCLLFVITFLWTCYKRMPSWEGEVAIISLLSIACVSLFSYPLVYTFTWVVIIFNMWILIQPKLPNVGRFVTRVIMIIVITTSALMLYYVNKRITAEYAWYMAEKCAPHNDRNMLCYQYDKLMSELGNDPYFLYNYSAELYINGEYEKSINIARKCRRYWADYDLELLMGECCMQLGDYENAAKHYTHASHMCPVRFMPLYKLYKLYKKLGYDNQAQKLGCEILKKTIKIQSPTIDLIKNDVRHTLNLEYK